jgi:predicted N-acyltransferase
VRSAHALHGRYWGALRPAPGLHFEACYYQGIEHCIDQGIAAFEGGAQGAHKLARGLLPVITRSAHWIADADFAAAVDHFVATERLEIGAVHDELVERSPFRAGTQARAAGDDLRSGTAHDVQSARAYEQTPRERE